MHLLSMRCQYFLGKCDTDWREGKPELARKIRSGLPCIRDLIIAPKFKSSVLNATLRSAYPYRENPFPAMQKSEMTVLTAASGISRGPVITSL